MYAFCNIHYSLFELYNRKIYIPLHNANHLTNSTVLLAILTTYCVTQITKRFFVKSILSFSFGWRNSSVTFYNEKWQIFFVFHQQNYAKTTKLISFKVCGGLAYNHKEEPIHVWSGSGSFCFTSFNMAIHGVSFDRGMLSPQGNCYYSCRNMRNRIF